MKKNILKKSIPLKTLLFVLISGVFFLAGCTKLTIENDGNGMTDPSGEINVPLNRAIPISATPNTGYIFSLWTLVSGTGVTFDNSSSANTTVTLTESDAVIRADFIKQFTLTVESSGCGTTSPSGSITVDNGTEAAISATPETGCIFNGWSIVSGTGVTIDNATSADTTVTLTETDATIRAEFTKQFALTIESDGCGTTVPSGIITVDNNTATDISAAPETGCIFNGWTLISGTGVTIADNSSASTTVTLTETDATVSAGFLKIPKLYVPNYDDDTVTVIDGLTGDIDDTIDVSTYIRPAAVGVNPVTGKIYIVHYNANISVIDSSTNSVTETISYAGSDYPSVAVNPVTNTVFAASQYDTDILVIDGSTDTLEGTFFNDYSDYDGTYPIGMAVNPVTGKLYILDSGDNVLYIYNASTYAYITEIDPIENDYIGVSLAINADTNRVYVPEWDTNALMIINGSTDTVITDVSVGNEPRGSAVNTGTNTIYVTNQADDTVSVIDGDNNTVITTISVGDEPLGVAVSKNFNMVYVVNSADNTTSFIDGETNSVIDTVTVGANPQFIGVLE